MSDVVHRESSAPSTEPEVGSQAAPPAPRVPMRVRVAVADDLAFIDALQKMHSHMVGWSPRKQLEASIADGHVLIAEAMESPGANVASPESEVQDPESRIQGRECLGAATLDSGRWAGDSRIGYCIARDRYMKRDDVGVVYQLNVMPLRQRSLVGASLIRAVFERAAYGCRLFSCWCAQDIQANYFWESIGFLPLAFRTGSRRRQRIHIFWQRRVRQDDEDTPYWFPSQTTAGAVAEDRLVLPIPPGTHWRDAKPIVLPGLVAAPPEAPRTLAGGAPVRPRPDAEASGSRTMTRAAVAAIARGKSRHLGAVPPGKAAIITSGGVRYVERADAPPPEAPPPEAPEALELPRPKRRAARKPRQKSDPKHVAAARELRDRFLERVNSGRLMLVGRGKYDVSRSLEAGAAELQRTLLLTAANAAHS